MPKYKYPPTPPGSPGVWDVSLVPLLILPQGLEIRIWVPPLPPWYLYAHGTNLYAPAPRNARNQKKGLISAPMARQKLSMSEIPIACRAEAIGGAFRALERGLGRQGEAF